MVMICMKLGYQMQKKYHNKVFKTQKFKNKNGWMMLFDIDVLSNF